MAAVGASALAASPTPLATAVEAGHLAWLSPIVRVGATIASLGVLLSLIAGVSRTTFAMATRRDLPEVLSAVHPRFRIPHYADVAIGAIVAGIVTVADIRSAIGFSSFAVLTYYAVANASAWTLKPLERRWPRWIAGLGVLGCLALATTLPLTSVVAGSAVLLSGALLYVARGARSRKHEPGD